jgi:16S rRNA C967 or C1407 C5-methylase (RsmB/RsmF family)
MNAVDAQYFELLHLLLPRYLRVRNPAEIDAAIRRLEGVLSGSDSLSVHRVDWLPGFLCVPGYVPISTWKPLQLGFYPMDVGSALAVVELFSTLPTTNDSSSVSVLDLCCCPGSKYQMIADTLRQHSRNGVVVGVDICAKRIQVCKNLIKKWDQVLEATSEDRRTGPRQLLFHCDGTRFGVNNGETNHGELVYDSLVFDGELNKKRKRMNKSAKAREKKRLLEVQSNLSTGLSSVREGTEEVEEVKDGAEGRTEDGVFGPYDYALVDAECSHDGSYRHMRYCAEEDNSTDQLENSEAKADCAVSTGKALKPSASIPYSTDEQKERLKLLQRSLISNGFRQLAHGGILVYSTCSHEDEQNEDIVNWFLENHPSARLIPCECGLLSPSSDEESTTNNSSSNGKDGAHDTVTSAEQILQLPPTELVTSLSSKSSHEIRAISADVCKFVCARSSPPVEQGKLPATIRLSKSVGMSGLFIAKFIKSS